MNTATNLTSPLYATWSLEEQKTFRDWLHGLLKSEIVTVTFIKKDSTERIMRCTLHENKLPSVDRRDERQTSNTAISVWDLDIEAWRSFRFDSIRTIQFLS